MWRRKKRWLHELEAEDAAEGAASLDITLWMILSINAECAFVWRTICSAPVKVLKRINGMITPILLLQDNQKSAISTTRANIGIMPWACDKAGV